MPRRPLLGTESSREAGAASSQGAAAAAAALPKTHGPFLFDALGGVGQRAQLLPEEVDSGAQLHLRVESWKMSAFGPASKL